MLSDIYAQKWGPKQGGGVELWVVPRWDLMELNPTNTRVPFSKNGVNGDLAFSETCATCGAESHTCYAQMHISDLWDAGTDK